MNQRDQVLDEWVEADIYSCVSAAIGFTVVPSPWQAVPVSVFDTHSLGRMAQSRPYWHRTHAKLFFCDKIEQQERGRSGKKVQRRDSEL